MAQHLHDMQIDKVSLVDQGANKRRIAVLKSANQTPLAEAPPREPVEGDEELTILQKVGRALGWQVDKAETFGEMRAARAATEAADEGFGIMQSAFWSAVYATDDDGNDLSVDAKKSLVSTSLDQFGTFLLDAMTVDKADSDAQDALDVLAPILKGVKAGRWSAAVDKEQDMDAQELEAMVGTKVDEAIAKALDEGGALAVAISKAIEAGVTKTTEVVTETTATIETEVEKVEDATALLTEMSTTQGQVIEAVAKLADRIEAIERPQRQSLDGQDTVTKTKSKSPLAGIL